MTVVEENALNGNSVDEVEGNGVEECGDGGERLEGGRGSASPSNYNPSDHVLHVVVVGFHHKKGCQVRKGYFNR
jgi:hypothetical protein